MPFFFVDFLGHLLYAMAHCDQEGVKEQPCFQPTSDTPIDDNIGTSQQEDDHEGDRVAVTANKRVTLPYQSTKEDGEREIDSQKCTLQHLSELACQIELERKDKYASTSNGNNGHVIHEVTKNNLHYNKNAENSPNPSEVVDDFALPLWVKVLARFFLALSHFSVIFFYFRNLLKASIIIKDYIKGRDPLTTGYLDNLDNGFSNKYEKTLKIRKRL
jgi:hypothetical protein